jgi:hypothetical protein
VSDAPADPVAGDVPDVWLDGDILQLAVPGGDRWCIPLAAVVSLQCDPLDGGVSLRVVAWPSATAPRRVWVNMFVEGDPQRLEVLMDRIGEIDRKRHEMREPVPAGPVVEPYRAPTPEPIVGVGYTELDTDWLTFRPLRDTLALADGSLIRAEKAAEP